MSELSEKEYISLLLEKMQHEVLNKQEYTYLQYLLVKNEDLYRSNWINSSVYPLCKTIVTGSKIMFIADTHFGNREIENRALVVAAYNTALQQNIKTVIHVGDLIEACSFEHSKKYDIVLKELETALYYMPNEITTKLLLGNHDYSAIRKYPEIIPYYFGYTKLDILGMQKVIVNWDGEDIRLNHFISQLKYPETNEYEGIITIEGHHHYHEFKEDEWKINLASLSNHCLSRIPPDFDKGKCPAFLIASKPDEKILLFDVYCANQNQNNFLTASKQIEVDLRTRKLTLHK